MFVPWPLMSVVSHLPTSSSLTSHTWGLLAWQPEHVWTPGVQKRDLGALTCSTLVWEKASSERGREGSHSVSLKASH